MNIEYDKRLELIFGLQYVVSKKNNLSNYSWLNIVKLPPYLNGPYISYKNYDEEFYGMAINNISKDFEVFIINNGFGTYHKTAELALSLDNEYNLHNNGVNKTKQELETISNYIKDFVEKSNYEEFYKNHKNYYDEIKKQFYENLNMYMRFNSKMLEDFYGFSIGNLNILLNNFGGNFSIKINDENNYVDGIYNKSKDKDKLELEDGFIVRALHEFSHAFNRQFSVKYFEKLSLDDLQKYMMDNNAPFHDYKNNLSFIDEIINRILPLAILYRNNFDKDIINKQIQRSKNTEIFFADELFDLIINNRDNYKTYEEFFKNEIVNYFINLNEKIKNGSCMFCKVH